MKIYYISDIITGADKTKDNHIGIFEDTSDPNIEWPHRHHFYAIVWFTQGTGINVMDFEEHRILPTRIFTISPRQIHNWSYSVDCKGYFILIDQHLASQLGIDFYDHYVDIKITEVAFFKEVFSRMLLPVDPSPSISYLFHLLFGNRTNQFIPNDSIDHFKKLVSRNLDNNYKIDNYATQLNLSVDKLNQGSKSRTGSTPKQLQLELRITEAKRLLAYSTRNITEISFLVGFNDSSYFSRIFKKKVQFSPEDFRKKYLKHLQKS